MGRVNDQQYGLPAPPQQDQYNNSFISSQHGYVEASAPPAEVPGQSGAVTEAHGAIEAMGYVPILDVGAAAILAEAIIGDCDGCSWHYTYAIVASVVSLVFSIAHAVMKQEVASRTSIALAPCAF